MTRSDRPPPLDEDHAAFVASGVSILVASRDAGNVPSIARAIGCRVSTDRRRVTVLLPAGSSRELLEHLRATGAIAAVFSEPSSHRTIQLKGSDARVEPPAPDDAQRIEAHLRRFARDIGTMGFDEGFARTLHDHEPGDVVAVSFTVASAFLQTPGPGAGSPLRA